MARRLNLVRPRPCFPSRYECPIVAENGRPTAAAPPAPSSVTTAAVVRPRPGAIIWGAKEFTNVRNNQRLRTNYEERRGERLKTCVVAA